MNDIPDDDVDEVPIDAEITQITIQLSEEQGSTIKMLIHETYPHTYPHYCQKVGIKTPNFYNVLNGQKPCTLEFLNKILSGINYQAILTNPEIVIREMEIGQIVPNADSIIQEIELQSREKEELDEYE